MHSQLQYYKSLPVADPSLVSTRMVKSYDDGLLRVKMSCTRSLPSATSYTWLAKFTAATANV